ncbi:transposase family protein [Dyadobacter sp. CY327]|uniref:integrase catalytic domain-containing protein n=1 Tax=Dyadobacter sp. CY327 TaxID=2907301 RepID=UPI0038D43EAE
MDFVQDALFNGERFRVLTVVDNCSKICHALLAGKSLRGIDVVAELSRICLVEGRFTERIQCDNGSEFISKEMDLWLNYQLWGGGGGGGGGGAAQRGAVF